MARLTISNATRLAAVAILPVAVVSCNGDDTSNGASGSGGAPSNDATGGGGTSIGGTTGTDAASDRTLPDAWVPPNGTKLASGDLSLVGVTTDSYAIYGNEANGTLYAVSLTGGEPTTIGTFGDRILVRGRVVVQWAGTSTVAPLSVWTATYGIKSLSSASYPGTAAIALSPDNSRILFFDGVEDGRAAGDLWIANIDGTDKTLLAEGVALSNPSCAPSLAFGGNTAAAAAFCWAANSIDASTTAAAVVQAYSGESWTASELATGVSPRVAIAPTGASVLVTGPTGLVAYPVLGGSGSMIDSEAGFGSFTNDGLSVVYTTPNQALKRSTIDSPAPVILAPSGFAGIRAISRDENWVLGYSVIDTSQDLSDLYLTSATAPGTVTSLSALPTAGLFGSDGFTTDSTRALYYTDISNRVGTLFSAPVGGGTPGALGSNVSGHHAGSEAYVVFNDYDAATRTGAIKVANAGQTVSSVIVSLADADFFVAETKDKVVYTWKYLGGDMAGLWVATIPSFSSSPAASTHAQSR
jgi:hypothetical protein